jgi:hypothetical protein
VFDSNKCGKLTAQHNDMNSMKKRLEYLNLLRKMRPRGPVIPVNLHPYQRRSENVRILHSRTDLFGFKWSCVACVWICLFVCLCVCELFHLMKLSIDTFSLEIFTLKLNDNSKTDLKQDWKEWTELICYRIGILAKFYKKGIKRLGSITLNLWNFAGCRSIKFANKTLSVHLLHIPSCNKTFNYLQRLLVSAFCSNHHMIRHHFELM